MFLIREHYCRSVKVFQSAIGNLTYTTAVATFWEKNAVVILEEMYRRGKG